MRAMDKETIYKIWYYFRRGHAIYFSMIMGMVNFFVIQYEFVIKRHPLFEAVFPSLTLFALLTLPFYVMLCAVVAFYERKWGVYDIEQSIMYEMILKKKKRRK